MEDKFMKASRMKLRFKSSRGLLSVEDVWDLPLTSAKGACLDALAITLNRQIKDSEEKSFVTKRTAASEELTLAFDIVKYVIDVRLAENEAAKKAADRNPRNQRIMEIIHSKQDESLRAKSVEELEALLDEDAA